MMEVIGPAYNSDHKFLKYHGLKALALYVMLEKKTCIEYFQVFTEILKDI